MTFADNLKQLIRKDLKKTIILIDNIINIYTKYPKQIFSFGNLIIFIFKPYLPNNNFIYDYLKNTTTFIYFDNKLKLILVVTYLTSTL